MKKSLIMLSLKMDRLMTSADFLMDPGFKVGNKNSKRS